MSSSRLRTTATLYVFIEIIDRTVIDTVQELQWTTLAPEVYGGLTLSQSWHDLTVQQQSVRLPHSSGRR